MTPLTAHSESATLPDIFKLQRTLLAACILLAPLSVTLYLVTWSGNLRQPLVAAAQADPTANALHLIGGVAAAFFLPLGYLGMSLLGMRRSPGLATLSVALSLIGWIPWSGLIGLDDLAVDITQAGSTQQLTAMWTHFNSDPVMSTFLIIYIIGHLLSAIVIAIMLRRLRLIPAWAAWGFALTTPLGMLYFILPASLEVKNALKYLLCVLSIISVIPMARAMLQNKNLA